MSDMKAFIHYIAHYTPSIVQAQQCANSFKVYDGWDPILQKGYTPQLLPGVKIPTIKRGSRLHDFRVENENRFKTKLSCAMNHVRFWRKVVQLDQPCAFIEHDAICVGSWKDYSFDQYLIMNADHVFRPPNKLAIKQTQNFTWPKTKRPAKLPSDYPLQYYRPNDWKGSNMVPGTAAYAITPQAAQHMLDVVYSQGIDQSDFMLNSFNLNIEYMTLFKFNTTNLSTSYGI